MSGTKRRGKGSSSGSAFRSKNKNYLRSTTISSPAPFLLDPLRKTRTSVVSPTHTNDSLEPVKDKRRKSSTQTELASISAPNKAIPETETPFQPNLLNRVSNCPANPAETENDNKLHELQHQEIRSADLERNHKLENERDNVFESSVGPASSVQALERDDDFVELEVMDVPCPRVKRSLFSMRKGSRVKKLATHHHQTVARKQASLLVLFFPGKETFHFSCRYIPSRLSFFDNPFVALFVKCVLLAFQSPNHLITNASVNPVDVHDNVLLS